MTTHTHRALAALVVTLVSIGMGPALFAAVVSIPPSKDNSLIESNSGSSCGIGPLFGGETSFALSRRIVIAFDVASQIPAGSTVNSVELQMNVTKAGRGSSSSDMYQLHRLLADWGESTSNCFGGQGAPAAPGDATWSDRFFGTLTWSSPGGDFSGVVSAAAPIPTLGAAVWNSQPGSVADVQSWVDSPCSNFGWIIIGNESAPGSAREFDSREGGTPPSLVVDYSPPAAGPPEVPDGRSAPPLRLSRLSSDGGNLLVEWDSALCTGNTNHNILYGTGSSLPAVLGGPYALAGSVCGIGHSSPYTWTGSPDPVILDPTRRLLWVLVVANDGATTEGSWGRDSLHQERQGLGLYCNSNQCGILNKSVSNTCGQGL